MDACLGFKDQTALVHIIAPAANVDVQALDLVIICHAHLAVVVQKLVVVAAEHATVVRSLFVVALEHVVIALKFLAFLA